MKTRADKDLVLERHPGNNVHGLHNNHHFSTMNTITNPAVPKGSTVLVIGANGFLGSHIADQFLRHGYKVRATVRDPAKDAWAVKLFSKLYGNGRFELVAVPDMEPEGAFDEVVKGKPTLRPHNPQGS